MLCDAATTRRRSGPVSPSNLFVIIHSFGRARFGAHACLTRGQVTYYNRSARPRGEAGKGCGHALLQDHVLMFGCGKLLAKFEYQEVHPYTV